MKSAETKILPPGIHGGRPESRWRAFLAAVLRFPFKIAGSVVSHVIQIIFAIFVLFLHPQLRWFSHAVAQSWVVQRHVRPALRSFVAGYYDPYFDYLRTLSPYWATLSIALPLAIVEPAKLYATILIAEHPRAGLVLWLALQGIGFVLIDRTWASVRPQSRKVWLVSRVHAWGWLMVAHGKYWIGRSAFYRSLTQWKKAAAAKFGRFFMRLRRGGLRRL
jgi:hypothetical protein